MAVHHMKLNCSKTGLLFTPGTFGPDCDPVIPFNDSLVSKDARGMLSKDALSLGCNSGWPITGLMFSTLCSCWFFLCNFQSIWPFSQERPPRYLLSLLSSHGCWLIFLTYMDFQTLQAIQNNAALLIFRHSHFTHVIPQLSSLYWLSVAATD